MDEWTGSDGRVDVAAIMAGIREKIRGRRDLGLYTDEEVEELTALRLQAFADDAGIDPDLLSRLMAANHNWNISTDYRIETHRAGLKGRQYLPNSPIYWPHTRIRPVHSSGPWSLSTWFVSTASPASRGMRISLPSPITRAA